MSRPGRSVTPLTMVRGGAAAVRSFRLSGNAGRRFKGRLSAGTIGFRRTALAWLLRRPGSSGLAGTWVRQGPETERNGAPVRRPGFMGPAACGGLTLRPSQKQESHKFPDLGTGGANQAQAEL